MTPTPADAAPQELRADGETDRDVALCVLDAGGSRIRLLLVGMDGRLLAALGATGAPRAQGVEAADGAWLAARVANIASRACTAAAATTARPQGVGLWHVVAGVAGAGRDAAAERARRAIASGLQAAGISAASLSVTTDAHLALQAAAATRPGPASVLLAGTGSIALATDGRGQVVRVGGYGRYLDDEGSGFWFGARTLQWAVRAGDGRAPAALPLAAAALATLGLADVDALVEAAPRLWETPGAVAALAPVALTLAAQGDPLARRVLRQGGRHLAGLALAARRRLGLGPEAPLAFAGGLFSAQLPLAVRPHGGGSAPPANPLPEAVRRLLSSAVPCGPLPVPPAVGGACHWLAAHGGPPAVRRLLQEVEPYRAELG
jgi:N-acetylglucosamine kinase-like BadF-type ATPase